MDDDGMRERLERLKNRMLARLAVPARLETAVSGLTISRYDSEVSAEKCFYNPIVAMVVQGQKHSLVGDRPIDCDEGDGMIVGVDMPGVFHITRASSQCPFLSLSVKLDRRMVTQLITDMPSMTVTDTGLPNPVAVFKVTVDLLDAFARLLALLDTPERIPVLAPMILREIHFHVLNGPQGECLRMFCTQGIQASRIARAISWLRENYVSPLQVNERAQRVNMASSTFNRHFRKVTGFSPLQFQKRLRLYEAERLMLHEGKDASTAAVMVGYESSSQFSREYKRLFGEPPRRDVIRKCS